VEGVQTDDRWRSLAGAENKVYEKAAPVSQSGLVIARQFAAIQFLSRKNTFPLGGALVMLLFTTLPR
jgi:hypothetical protein